jgi:hypothetical protein
MDNFKFPQYINTNERVIAVHGMIKNNSTKEDYLVGKGYIRDDDSIWIYSDKKPNKSIINSYPYFWLCEDGSIGYSNPSDFIRNIYRVESMQDISVVTIIDTTSPDEKLYNEVREAVDIPVMAAGGITAENVKSIINDLSPDMIDVMSGVEESTGVKSEAKIEKLIQQIKVRKG